MAETVARDRQFERGIWHEAAYRYRQAILLILVIVPLFVAIDIFVAVSGRTAASNASSIAWAMLAISVHGAILNGTSAKMLSGKVLWPFLWRSFVLAIPGSIVAMPIAIWLANPENISRFVLALIPPYGVTMALILGLWGTWLPAVVANNGDRSFAAATSRGRRVFGYVFPRLLVGCGGTGVASFLFLFGALILGDKMGFETEIAKGVIPYDLVVSAIFYAALAFMFVMLPVILSRAYHIAESSNPVDVPRPSPAT